MKKCFVYFMSLIMAIGCCIFATTHNGSNNQTYVYAAETDTDNYELSGNTFYIKTQTRYYD